MLHVCAHIAVPATVVASLASLRLKVWLVNQTAAGSSRFQSREFIGTYCIYLHTEMLYLTTLSLSCSVNLFPIAANLSLKPLSTMTPRVGRFIKLALFLACVMGF